MAPNWKSEDLEKELEFDTEEKENELAELEEEIEKKHPGLLPKRGRPVKYGDRAVPPRQKAELPRLPRAPKLSAPIPPMPPEDDLEYDNEEEGEAEPPEEEEETEEEEVLPAQKQRLPAFRPEERKAKTVPQIPIQPVQPQEKSQIPVTPAVPVRRFEPYTIAETFGVVDNITGAAKYEALSETKLIVLMLADILNRIEMLDRKL